MTTTQPTIDDLALIAEEVMGWKRVEEPSYVGEPEEWEALDSGQFFIRDGFIIASSSPDGLFDPWNSDADAVAVLRNLGCYDLCIDPETHKTCITVWCNGNNLDFSDDELRHAITHAALAVAKAKRGKHA